MEKYVLDTNIFIEAKNRYYRFSICRGFWDFLRKTKEGIFSLQEVFEELKDKEDELNVFAKELEQCEFFRESNAQDCYDEIYNILREMEYREEAIVDFVSKADFALVAYAYKHKCIIVTHESAGYGENYTRRRVKIPDICNRLGITCINTFEFLEREKAFFILEENLK